MYEFTCLPVHRWLNISGPPELKQQGALGSDVCWFGVFEGSKVDYKRNMAGKEIPSV